MMENLIAIVTLLVALSAASERLVEIIKGIVPWLNNTNTDKKVEGWRKSSIQTIAVLAGILTAFLAQDAIIAIVPDSWPSENSIIALGFLASGGSALWNSILTYLLNIKDIKKIEKQTALERLNQMTE